MRKLDLHSDYLSERNVVVAFASDFVDNATKAEMAERLLEQDVVEVEKGKPIAPRIYKESTLASFIGEESWLLFKVCKVHPTFLSKPVEEWSDDASYCHFKYLVEGFTPVNDAAECAVKFATDYHGKITHNTKQHQAMLQGIEEHRTNYPKPTKKEFME